MNERFHIHRSWDFCQELAILGASELRMHTAVIIPKPQLLSLSSKILMHALRVDIGNPIT